MSERWHSFTTGEQLLVIAFSPLWLPLAGVVTFGWAAIKAADLAGELIFG